MRAALQEAPALTSAAVLQIVQLAVGVAAKVDQIRAEAANLRLRAWEKWAEEADKHIAKGKLSIWVGDEPDPPLAGSRTKMGSSSPSPRR